MNPELIGWLSQQQTWLQIAANRLLTNGPLSEADIANLAAIIKDPALVLDAQLGTTVTPQPAAGVAELRLVSLGPVEGIDALNPRTPLNFGGQNLVVVYGDNASGKSGYTRIICKACGKSSAGALKSNVFAPAPVRQMCKIKYSQGGTETEVEWTPAFPIAALAALDVFDTASGRIYLENETEAAFLPPDLAFMSDLVAACNQVEAILLAEERQLVGALPTIETALFNTAASTAFRRSLNHAATEDEIRTLTDWTPENARELETVNSSLSNSDPIVSAQKRRRVRQQREVLAQAIDQAVGQLTAPGIEITRTNIANAATKRRIATEAATALQTKSEISGVGSETWRALWAAARQFATDEFPFRPFPDLETGARCLFCHQELDGAARERLTAFETFISGTIEAEAATAEQELATHLASIKLRPTSDALQTAAQAAELDQQTTDSLEEVWTALESHLEPLRSGIISTVAYTPTANVMSLVRSLRELAARAGSEAEALVLSADPEARRQTESRQKELRAKKWISEQSAPIRAEVTRLKQIHNYQQWKRQTDTRGLSRKAGELSQTLVTEAYIRRFNDELRSLAAGDVRVELVMSRTERGRSKHVIQLRNTTTPTARIADILSEGERRIISLAASLADVAGRALSSPFIFDDPISSLDQTWEERTIDRLIALSSSRQVIVFTHRLSLLGIITEKANALHTVYIRREPWGTGQPGEIALDAKRPDRALSDLKTRRLNQARNTLDRDGNDAYYPLAKSICTDLRVLLERIIEFVLLADVVQRHRRAINTQGKFHLLSRIRREDCDFIEEMMTKYSRYEHSQTNEAPVRPPEPDEISADIDRLLSWHQEYTSRTV